MTENGLKWENEFKALEKLARHELSQLQVKVNHAIETLNRGIADEDFLASFKETIDKGSQMNQLYGVLRYTKRWNNVEANTGTSQTTPSGTRPQNS